jgi:hypothetical protein
MLSCGHTNGWGRQAKLVAGGLPSRQLTQDRRALEKKHRIGPEESWSRHPDLEWRTWVAMKVAGHNTYWLCFFPPHPSLNISFWLQPRSAAIAPSLWSCSCVQKLFV